MKLYWAPRTRSFRAVWMVEETGLPYERQRIDIHAGEQSTPEYRAVNPMMKVPALVDGDVRVAESAAICTYLAERAPDKHLAPPIGDSKRGDFLRLMFFAAGCIEAAYVQKFTGLQMPSVSAGWGDFDRVVNVLDGSLANGPWLLGDQFSAADVMIGGDLHFGVDVFKIVEPRPRFRAFLDRCAARPAYQRASEIEAAG
jgi:glutathione S-transferase